VILCLVLLLSVPAFGQQDPNDQGAADWTWLAIEDAFITPADSLARADLYVSNDAQLLTVVAVGMTWDNPTVHLDSVILGQAARDAFDGIYLLDGDLETTNANQRFMFIGVSIMVPHLPTTGESHLMASYYFSDETWGAGDSCCIDTTSWEPNVYLTFVDTTGTEYIPRWGGPVCAWAEGFPTECWGTIGNVMLQPECDSLDQTVDIVDIQLLIDHQFLTLRPLCWWREADLDYSGEIDITDLQLMVDHQYLSLDPFPECP
jgi:hypothetical protein